MMGAIIKSFFAEREGIDPKKIFSVSIMPCTAKKFEARAARRWRATASPDVDAVLTTRELAQTDPACAASTWTRSAPDAAGHALRRAQHARASSSAPPAA